MVIQIGVSNSSMGNKMRFSHCKVALAGFLLSLACLTAPLSAEPPAGWKSQVLPEVEEKRWIDAVKLHKTYEGVSVIQVLQFAEKVRPKKFKIESFDIGYDSKGKPDGVRIGYWIGAKQLPGDEFSDLWYDIKSEASVTAVPRTNRYTSDSISNALEGGRDSFLAYIDKMYEETCVDPDTRQKTC